MEGGRRLADGISGRFFIAVAVLSASLVLAIAGVLYFQSRPLLEANSLPSLLLGTTWAPSEGKFGFYPFIMGTLCVTLLAMAFAVPIGVLSAVYLSEYASSRVREAFMPVMDLLAGIPPVVYGAWGVLAIVPFVAAIAPSSSTTGFSLLSAALVLSLMVLPIIISISEQVLRAVPLEMREASLSLGATRWQTFKHAIFGEALPGMAAAVALGFSRAFGETIAVMMVVGNVPKIPASIFAPAYPLTALIANNYGERMSIPLYGSALLFAALILMAVVLLFTVAARLTLLSIRRRYADGN